MEKINIAELLKDCPKGMELDCVVYNNLSYDYVNVEQGRIYCKVDKRDTVWFTIYGCVNLAPSAKCVIFPKGKTTWEGFVPPQGIRWNDELNKIEYRICSSWYDASLVYLYKESPMYLNEKANKQTEEIKKILEPMKEMMEERKYSELRTPLDDDDKLATEATIDGNKITPPENYLIGNVTKVNNGMLVEFVKKKPQYPKTYEECCDVLKIPNDERYIDIDVPLDYNKLLSTFTKLLICRDAYWKIAGDWKPQFENCSIPHYCIFINHTGEIYNGCFYGSRCLLVFPTKEMRDAFYENFKNAIETCKELL